MRFRLKDRELQKKLDEISNGGLSRMLGRLPYYTTQSSEPDFLHFSKNPHLMLEVTSDMLESLREYNPHGWNSFPEVEPPEGVLMRVECNQMKTCLVFENGKWRYPSGESFEGSSSKPPSLNDGGADLFKRVTFDQVLKSVESSRER